MHQLNIIHGHIKLSNILLTEKAVSKLGNFSKANQLLNNSYISLNEKHTDEKNDVKYDVFLLGIICIELFKGNNDSFNRNNFINSFKKNNNNSKKKIENIFFSGKEQLCSKDFIDFVKKCLESNSYLRPSAFELKNHPFIKNNSNPTNSEKLYFSNLIRFNIEKIEYNKKKTNYISNNSLKKSNLKSNEKNLLKKSNINNTNNSLKKSNVSNTTKNLNSFYNYNYSIYSTKTKDDNINNTEKNSVNISNKTKDKNNDNNTLNVDKLAEFRMDQMKNSVEVEFDRYTSNDVLVDKSNLENNSEYYYATDNSFHKSMKASAILGKGELEKENKTNNKTYIKKKDSSFIKKIIDGKKNKNINNKKQENFMAKDNSFNNISISENENNFLKKESEENDYFKDNWEHLNKYKDIFKPKVSEKNINYNCNNNFLHLNSDDSFDLNNNLNNNYINNFNNNNLSKQNFSVINDNNYYNIQNKSINNKVAFSEMKCNVIQLGNSIKKNSPDKKSNYISEYSLKNSFFKVNENIDFSIKKSLNKTNENLINFNKNSINGSSSQKLLLSFRNNTITNTDINLKKSFTKDKNYKNDISSTCFTSLNTPINKMKSAMGIIPEVHYSCSPFFTVRQKNFEENDYNFINSKNFENNNEKNNVKKSFSEYNYRIKRNNEKTYLYNYIKEMESKNKTDDRLKANNKKKNIVIKMEKLFVKKNNSKINFKKNIQNIVINNKK